MAAALLDPAGERRIAGHLEDDGRERQAQQERQGQITSGCITLIAVPMSRAVNAT